jgi:hypothetical protein
MILLCCSIPPLHSEALAEWEKQRHCSDKSSNANGGWMIFATSILQRWWKRYNEDPILSSTLVLFTCPLESKFWGCLFVGFPQVQSKFLNVVNFKPESHKQILLGGSVSSTFKNNASLIFLDVGTFVCRYRIVPNIIWVLDCLVEVIDTAKEWWWFWELLMLFGVLFKVRRKTGFNF